MKALIIDDEIQGRVALKQKIADYCPAINVVGEAANGKDGIALIEEVNPDIIFLDIEMPRMTGFEMLANLKKKDFHVVFTTAYDQYAIKAIKFSAFDYLLKPVDIEELKAAVDRITTIKTFQTNEQAAVLQENIIQPKKKLNKLAIPTIEGLLFFEINIITYLEASANYTNIHFSDNTKIIASKTLKDFEELLPHDVFFRVHNSFLINLNCIKRYIRGDGGQVELSDGNIIDVSRRKKDEFLKIICY
jgi:two-component system, LytTR family, response regulator